MFVHRLCLELHMTKGDLVQKMTARELLDWSEYFDRIQNTDPDPQKLASAFGALG